MKKTIVTMLSILFLLVTMATAQATSYTSTVDVTGSFSFTGFDNNDSIVLSLSGITGAITPSFPPSGVYDWSLGLNSFAVDLNGSGVDYEIGPLGSIDIGTYALPTLSSTGSASLGDVIIPFSLFGLAGGDSLTLTNFMVAWTMPTDDSIVFTITAADMTELKDYLTGLNGLALSEYGHGIESGTFAFNGSLTASAVPEPSTAILLGLGLIGILGAGRMKFRKS